MADTAAWAKEFATQNWIRAPDTKSQFLVHELGTYQPFAHHIARAQTHAIHPDENNAGHRMGRVREVFDNHKPIEKLFYTDPYSTVPRSMFAAGPMTREERSIPQHMVRVPARTQRNLI